MHNKLKTSLLMTDVDFVCIWKKTQGKVGFLTAEGLLDGEMQEQRDFARFDHRSLVRACRNISQRHTMRHGTVERQTEAAVALVRPAQSPVDRKFAHVVERWLPAWKRERFLWSGRAELKFQLYLLWFASCRSSPDGQGLQRWGSRGPPAPTKRPFSQHWRCAAACPRGPSKGHEFRALRCRPCRRNGSWADRIRTALQKNPVYQSINQSINQAINQSINRSIIDHSTAISRKSIVATQYRIYAISPLSTTRKRASTPKSVPNLIPDATT